jgi:hypothetical protein
MGGQMRVSQHVTCNISPALKYYYTFACVVSTTTYNIYNTYNVPKTYNTYNFYNRAPE